MEVRHNTKVLERAVELVVTRAETPLLAARAAARASLQRSDAIRRIATGTAIAVAAIGIGIGIFLSKNEPTPTVARSVPTQSQLTEVTPKVRDPQSQVTVPEKKSIETTNFTIFKSIEVPIGDKTWTIYAGHNFATGEEQAAGNWNAAWCTTEVNVDKLDVKISLGVRPTKWDIQSQPVYDQKFATSVGLNPEIIRQLAVKCPWMDGKTFNIGNGEVQLAHPEIKLIGSVLFYKGAIGNDFLQMLSQREFTTLDIDSPGGLVDEALGAGRWLRKNGKSVQTQKQCFSACVFVLAGGSTRQAVGDAQVGVHRFRSDAQATPDDLALGQEKSADILQYFQEMQVKPDLWLAMARTPAQDILLIPHKDLVDWNLLSPDVVTVGDGSTNNETISSENSAEKLPDPRRLFSLVGYDAAGGDIGGMPIRDSTDISCEENCRNDQSCLVATYNIKTRACFLKSKLVTVQKFPGAEIFYKNSVQTRLTELVNPN